MEEITQENRYVASEAPTERLLLNMAMDESNFWQIIPSKPVSQITRLITAVKQGNLQLVRRLAGKVDDINAFIGGVKYTAMMYAAEQGFTDIVDVLFQRNASISLRNRDGSHPLILAGFGWASIRLCELKADVQSVDDNGRTALSWAAGSGHTVVLQLLLELNADISIADRYDSSPLTWALREGHKETARKLVDFGAITDSCLIWIAKKGETSALKDLYSLKPHLDLNPVDQSGKSPAIWAAFNGHLDTLRILTDLNADLNCVDDDGFSALAWASHKSHLDIVQHIQGIGVDITQYLFRAVIQDQPQAIEAYFSLGANLEETRNENLNPLTLAIKYGKILAAHQLRKCGANLMPCIEWAVQNGRKDSLQALSELDNFEISLVSSFVLLNLAAQNRHFDVILHLHELKASVETRLEHNYTTLIHAADNGRMDVVKALLDLSANINCCDAHGRTALDKAAYRGDTHSVQALFYFGANLESSYTSALIEAVKQGKVVTAEKLLSLGGTEYLHVPDEFGCTPLIWGASKGNLEVVQILLDSRARLDDADCQGRTALIWASLEGNYKTVEVLCALGADLEAHDQDGYTALIHAASTGCVDSVQTLRVFGADTGHHNKRGFTALTAAVMNGHCEIVRLLCHWMGIYDMENRSAALQVAAECGNTSMIIELCTAARLHNADYSRALTWAARFGNAEAVLVLHALNADIDFRDSDGCTALIWAASNGHTKTVQSLRDLGALSELCDRAGMTAMQWAALHGHIDALQALHRSGADFTSCLIWAGQSGLLPDKLRILCSLDASIDTRDAGGRTSLFWAFDNHHVDTALALLELGADGSAALLHAACTGRSGAVRCALNLGVSHAACDLEGVPALVRAIKAGYNSTAKTLSDSADLCLLWAATTGNSESINALVSHGGSVHAKDGEGRSALGWAVYNGHIGTAHELCRLGACPGQCLLWAASRRKEADIKMLLAFKGSVNARDECGRSVIMLAISHSCSKSMVLRLLNAGAEEHPASMLNATDNDQCSVLGHALLAGHESAIKLLVGRGAKVTPCLVYAAKSGSMKVMHGVKRLHFKFTSTNCGRIIDIAAKSGHHEILRELHNLGVDCCLGNALSLAAENGKIGALKFLVSLHCKGIGHNDMMMYQAWWSSARNGHTECVVELVRSLSADINACDHRGQTALFLAAKSNQVGTVQTLCELRASVDVVDGSGLSALMAASRRGYAHIVRMLCTFKANPLLCCLEGKRAAVYAEEGRHHELSKFLEVEGRQWVKKRSYFLLWFRKEKSQWIWACSLKSGLEMYSSIDTVALESMYILYQETKYAPTKFCRKYVVRVLPNGRKPDNIVDVENMIQWNSVTKTCSKVLRFLPPFQSLCESVGNMYGSDATKLAKLQRFGKDAEEFAMIEQLFVGDGKGSCVARHQIAEVHRVHNKFLFDAFRLRTTCLRAACGNDWNETSMIQWLFHGTSDTNIDEIVHDNVFGFKSLLCKRTSFGRGTYFATKASYSVSREYCSSGRRIILAAVALGRSAEGHSDALFPPSGYHSFVNCSSNPTVFAIPDGASAYPAYVISLM